LGPFGSREYTTASGLAFIVWSIIPLITGI